MAFILVMIVAAVMQQVTTSTRAKLVCPQSRMDERALVQNLSQRCTTGVEYTKDINGCGVWLCKTP
ncbi:TPA: hypothetical protein DIV55_02070 [Patescibacteria group bacterium]|nr:hypothetical protein [Patescibacteria group bacterium]